MAWDLFSLPASSADSTLLHSQGQMDPHTPPPLLGMASSNTASWPRHGHLVISQTVRRKSRSQWSILQFMNRLNCDRICIQKLFQRRKGACGTGLPPGLPIKENLGGSVIQSEASDRHRHTLRGHNLNYTIWILYAESVSSLVNKCHFSSERALPK